MPHHSQRNPERHSAEKQFFLQTAHFELLGRLPSRQWWVWFTCAKSFPGKYVAFSLQSATAKSWHSVCAKYSHTENHKNLSIILSTCTKSWQSTYDTIREERKCKFFVYSFSSWIYRVIKTRWKIHRYNITSVIDKEYKRHLLSQCMDRLSSSRLRQTLQNFLLWCTCSDQQCATGFCATEQNLFHFSFFFFFFFFGRTQKRIFAIIFDEKETTRTKIFSSSRLFFVFESSYSGKKEKNNWLILERESNDDRPRLFLFELLFFFFSRKKRRGSWGFIIKIKSV